MEQEGLGLQFREVQPQAFVVAAAERNPLEVVFLVLGAFVAEAFRVEAFRVAPVLGHVVGVQRRQVDQGVLGNAVALEGHLLGGAAREGGQRRSQAQGLAEYPAGLGHLFQVAVAEPVRMFRGGGHLVHLLRQGVLPLRVFAEQVDQRAERAGGGVVGGEQQEDHVVGDVLVAQAAFFLGRLAQLAEEVRGVRLALFRDQPGHELLQITPAAQAPVPEGARYRQTQHRQRGVRRVNEGLVHLVRFRTHAQAEENLRAHVQQQRLDAVEEGEGFAGGPGLQAAFHARPHTVDVAGQGRFFERLLHDTAVKLVVGEIAQHQAVGEQPLENRIPGRPAGEHMLLVAQHEFVGVRAEQGDAALKQHAAAIHQAVALGLAVHQTVVVTQKRQRVAEQRQAVIPRDMAQVALWHFW